MQGLRLANHLDRSRFSVDVAVSRGGGSYEEALRPDIGLHVVGGALSRVSNTLSVASSVRPLRVLIAAQGYDVVVGFMNHVNVALMRAVSGMKRKPIAVLGVQNNPLVDYATPKGLTNRAVRRGMDTLYARADCIVSLSEGVRDALCQMLPLDAKRIEVIYNAGVDDRVLALAQETIPERPDGPLVVACGRLTAQKDYPTLLRAFRNVADETDASLWILGKGELEKPLAQQVQQLGLADRVRFLGFQKNPYAYMAQADVYALSSYYEGFGNVIVEAMASGAPVVSTDCPYGPGEIIEQNESGVLVPVGDDAALARSIIALLRDPDRAARMAERGKARAMRFHVDRIAEQYGRVLEDLVVAKREAKPTS